MIVRPKNHTINSPCSPTINLYLPSDTLFSVVLLNYLKNDALEFLNYSIVSGASTFHGNLGKILTLDIIFCVFCCARCHDEIDDGTLNLFKYIQYFLLLLFHSPLFICNREWRVKMIGFGGEMQCKDRSLHSESIKEMLHCELNLKWNYILYFGT